MARFDPTTSSSFPGGDNASVDRQRLKQAFEWFNKCRDTHSQCRPKDPSFRPHRLLHLGTPESQVKVEEFNGNLSSAFSRPIQYACLSHCWGDVKPPCMTNDNTLDSNKAGIDWDTIPKTFQEAIVFTRNLGLGYLWIDSLCIIQGNEEDWLKEGAMMAEIYSNATITIAASSANNCNEGLYRDWNDGRGEPSRPREHVCDWLTNYLAWLPTLPPLARRAWFFQEGILSPRVLHFDFEKVLWKCQCVSTCPCFHTESFPSASSVFDGDHKPVEDMEAWKMMTEWAKTVSTYSGLRITRHSDKLAALSGVAKASGHLERGHEYVAGLWKKSSGVPLALDWRTWGSSVHRRQRTEEWAAPSWSWASVVDGWIIDHWPSTVYPDSKPAFSIKDITLKPKLQSQNYAIGTGPLHREGTSITVSGRATEAKLVYDSQSTSDWAQPDMYRVSIGGVESRFQPDYTIGDKSNEEGYLESNSKVHCFFLFTRQGVPKMNPGSIETKMKLHIFLVLSQKHHSDGVRIFERIGLLSLNQRDYAMIQKMLVEMSTFCIV